MAAEGMQSHDQSWGNCPTASHPATKKGRINAPILPKPARCAKSDRLLGDHRACAVQPTTHRRKAAMLVLADRSRKSGRGEESMDAIWTCRLAIVAAIVGQSAYSQAQNAPSDPVRVLVGRLDLGTYKATIKGLTQFGDRREGTGRKPAAVAWVEAQLQSNGCTKTQPLHNLHAPPPHPPPPPPP